MTNYYLSTGYGNVYTTGFLENEVTLPLTDDAIITDCEWHASDDGVDIDLVVSEQKDNLQEGDTLTIVYPNQAALWILDEWSEEFGVPHNQREEIWTNEGIQDTHVYFAKAEDEDWYWLTDAETDYIDGIPVPVSLEDEG